LGPGDVAQGKVGHRVVQGGLKYGAPVRMTEDVLDDFAKLEPLARLRQSHNLAPIRAIMKLAPEIPQIVCFDTAFHRRQSSLAHALARPHLPPLAGASYSRT
jgi:acetate kinase